MLDSVVVQRSLWCWENPNGSFRPHWGKAFAALPQKWCLEVNAMIELHGMIPGTAAGGDVCLWMSYETGSKEKTCKPSLHVKFHAKQWFLVLFAGSRAPPGCTRYTWRSADPSSTCTNTFSSRACQSSWIMSLIWGAPNLNILLSLWWEKDKIKTRL